MLHFDSAIETSYVWVFLVINIFLCAYLFYHIFESRMKNRMHNMFCFTAVTSALMAVNRIINLSETGSKSIYNIIMILLLTSCTCLFLKGTIKQYIFSIVGIYITYAFGELISFQVMKSIQDVPYYSYIYYGPPLMVGVVVCNMYILLMVLLIVAVLKVKREHIRIRQLLVYIVFPIYQTILVIGFYAGTGNYDWKDATIGALIMIFSMIVDVIVINAIENMAQSIRADEQMLAMQLQRQTEHEYRKMTEHYVAQMQDVKQELSQQIKKAYQLIEADAKNIEITDALDVSLQGLQRTKVSRYCENSVVNSVLTVKKVTAGDKGIETKIAVTIPETLQIAQIDLCSVFSNLLDNAIEACEQLPESEEGKLISVKAALQAGFLIVKVENTKVNAVHKVNGMIKTSKRDKENHGYGLQLIRKIAEKYDGQVNVNFDENIFRVYVSLRN